MKSGRRSSACSCLPCLGDRVLPSLVRKGGWHRACARAEGSEHQPSPMPPSRPFRPMWPSGSQAPVLRLSLAASFQGLCLLGQFSLKVNQQMRPCGADSLGPARTSRGLTPSPGGQQPLIGRHSPPPGHRSEADSRGP